MRGAPTPPDALRAALNGCLPRDLRIRELARVARDFDVTRDALARYRYALPGGADGALRRVVASHAARAARARAATAAAAAGPAPLDAAAMRAASMLAGTHDFAGFQAAGGEHRGTVFGCAVEPRARGRRRRTS